MFCMNGEETQIQQNKRRLIPAYKTRSFWNVKAGQAQVQLITSTLHSLPKKMDDLLLLNGTNKDFARSAALCFTETWLSESIPDSGLHLPRFYVHWTDCVTELSGKDGRICIYIYKGWCTDVTVLSKYCSPYLETVYINCKPFYSAWEFSSFILVGVYIPHLASVNDALQTLADQITG